MSTTTKTKDQAQGGMSFRTLRPFLALTFGATWGIATLLIFFTDQIVSIFGEIGLANPVFILAVYAPGFAGVFLVWRHYGSAGLGSYLRRLTMWRMSAAWWGFLLVGIPIIVYAGAIMSGTASDSFPFSPWYGVLPALLLALLTGPLEEFGWRGVALPLLQRRFAPLWSSLILGGIWGLWHVPAFLLSGTPQSSWSFAPYVIGILAVSVIMTALFNATRGSILISALLHFQVMNPMFPDAQPWDTLTYVAAAVIIVILNRKNMLSRDNAVVEILMPGDEDVRSLSA